MKIKFAVEVSEYPYQHAHILPLALAMSLDDKVNLTLYATKMSSITKIKKLSLHIYKKQLISVDVIVKASNSSKLKSIIINLSTKFRLQKTLIFLRSVYGFFRVNGIAWDNDDSFYRINETFFKTQHIVATTELKSSLLFKEWGVKLIYCLHGLLSSDNPFYKSWHCDLVVSPQKNIHGRLIEKSKYQGLVYENAYLKKDVMEALAKKQNNNSLFMNPSNYTFVYNPHWDNSLSQSSWFDYSEKILEFFYLHEEFNIIVAPHINLNKLFKLNISDKYYQAKNIHIDIDSPKLFDGSYTLLADCYIGDVSSQYFEFLLSKPSIQSIFINTSNLKWDESSSFFYWKSGYVVSRINDLIKKIIYVSRNKNKLDTYYEDYFNEIPIEQVVNLKKFILSELI